MQSILPVHPAGSNPANPNKDFKEAEMQEKSDVLMQELIGDLATRAMVIYQQTVKEKFGMKEDLQFEAMVLHDDVGNLEIERNSLLEKLEQEKQKTTTLQNELKEQKDRAAMFCKFWFEERAKTQKPEAATSSQEESR